MKARIMAIPYTKSPRGGSWGHKRQRGCDGGDDYVYYYIGERLKLDGEGEYWRLSEEAERQWYSGPVPAPNLLDVKMGGHKQTLEANPTGSHRAMLPMMLFITIFAGD